MDASLRGPNSGRSIAKKSAATITVINFGEGLMAILRTNMADFAAADSAFTKVNVDFSMRDGTWL
jgi:hypothetical protein